MAKVVSLPPQIKINKAWCKPGCGICRSFCPKNVLEIGDDGKAYVKDATACINCGLCELRCPELAIELEERKDG